MLAQKTLRRNRIRASIRKKVYGTAARPRLSVFRSNRFIYAQIINDDLGITLAAASGKDPAIQTQKVNKTEQAKLVGRALAQKALEAGITQVVFDRGGYLYHGRVKALAEGAREGGLKF
jgi:large subunit ribosomal protein L18